MVKHYICQVNIKRLPTLTRPTHRKKEYFRVGTHVISYKILVHVAVEETWEKVKGKAKASEMLM